jgi:hypothetical protein
MVLLTGWFVSYFGMNYGKLFNHMIFFTRNPVSFSGGGGILFNEVFFLANSSANDIFLFDFDIY